MVEDDNNYNNTRMVIDGGWSRWDHHAGFNFNIWYIVDIPPMVGCGDDDR